MKQAPTLKFASDNSTSADFLVSRVIEAYQNLDPTRLDFATLYTSDVYFEDPTYGVQGKTAVLAHFLILLLSCKGCSFNFHRTVSNGADIFLAWTMTAKHLNFERQSSQGGGRKLLENKKRKDLLPPRLF